MVPVAKDGTKFTRCLARNGMYTVGPKGNEQRFRSYEQALDYLRKSSVAHWRRPNEIGNWGIVTGIDWVAQ